MASFLGDVFNSAIGGATQSLKESQDAKRKRRNDEETRARAFADEESAYQRNLGRKVKETEMDFQTKQSQMQRALPGVLAMEKQKREADLKLDQEMIQKKIEMRFGTRNKNTGLFEGGTASEWANKNPRQAELIIQKEQLGEMPEPPDDPAVSALVLAGKYEEALNAAKSEHDRKRVYNAAKFHYDMQKLKEPGNLPTGYRWNSEKNQAELTPGLPSEFGTKGRGGRGSGGGGGRAAGSSAPGKPGDPLKSLRIRSLEKRLENESKALDDMRNSIIEVTEDQMKAQTQKVNRLRKDYEAALIEAESGGGAVGSRPVDKSTPQGAAIIDEFRDMLRRVGRILPSGASVSAAPEIKIGKKAQQAK